MADIVFESHVDEILKELESKMEKALETCGLMAEGYAKRLAVVDTGRLRNSITHATEFNPGVDAYTDNNQNTYSGGAANATPEHGTVYIGTNVEYASFVENGTSKKGARPFLKPAVTNNSKKYKQVMEEIMKS